jgi:hypothetical protein
MCRVRNVHTTEPWSTAYICITVDDSCTDESGKYVDKPLTVRMVQWQPYCVKKPFDPKTPVCATCKRTNRTRGFCRERHKHRYLPWCTVYVLLSALDQTDPSTVVAAPSQKVDIDEDQENNSIGDESGNSKPKVASEDASTAGSDTIGSEADEESDDVNDISESRTFLAKVSSRGTSIHWLDLGEFDPQGDPAYVAQASDPHHSYGGPVVHGDPAQYYHSVGYGAQAHQNALKSHQQYFFQMHRHHHQLPPPTPPQPYPYVVPPPHWPQYSVGQGDSAPSGDTPGDAGTSGEGEGVVSKRSAADESYQAHHQQQWALYYGQHAYAPESAVHPGAMLQPEIHNAEQYPVEAPGDADDVDNKRQRVA